MSLRGKQDPAERDDVPLDWESLEHLVARVPRHVVHREFASETVLLNVRTGHYYGMDESGARFFRVLQESDDVGSAVERLAEEFDAPVERLREDMVQYCAELESLGLLELREQRH